MDDFRILLPDLLGISFAAELIDLKVGPLRVGWLIVILGRVAINAEPSALRQRLRISTQGHEIV